METQNHRLTPESFAAAYEAGKTNGREVTATLRHFAEDHGFLRSFAIEVAKLRNVDSSAKLGDLATALKAATKDEAMRLTFSFKKQKAYFGQAAGFDVAVIPYVAPVKDGGSDALAAIEKLGAYYGADITIEQAEAILVLLDGIETTGNATERKNGIRHACRNIVNPMD